MTPEAFTLIIEELKKLHMRVDSVKNLYARGLGAVHGTFASYFKAIEAAQEIREEARALHEAGVALEPLHELFKRMIDEQDPGAKNVGEELLKAQKEISAFIAKIPPKQETMRKAVERMQLEAEVLVDVLKVASEKSLTTMTPRPKDENLQWVYDIVWGKPDDSANDDPVSIGRN